MCDHRNLIISVQVHNSFLTQPMYDIPAEMTTGKIQVHCQTCGAIYRKAITESDGLSFTRAQATAIERFQKVYQEV